MRHKIELTVTMDSSDDQDARWTFSECLATMIREVCLPKPGEEIPFEQFERFQASHAEEHFAWAMEGERSDERPDELP